MASRSKGSKKTSKSTEVENKNGSSILSSSTNDAAANTMTTRTSKRLALRHNEVNAAQTSNRNQRRTTQVPKETKRSRAAVSSTREIAHNSNDEYLVDDEVAADAIYEYPDSETEAQEKINVIVSKPQRKVYGSKRKIHPTTRAGGSSSQTAVTAGNDIVIPPSRMHASMSEAESRLESQNSFLDSIQLGNKWKDVISNAEKLGQPTKDEDNTKSTELKKLAQALNKVKQHIRASVSQEELFAELSRSPFVFATFCKQLDGIHDIDDGVYEYFRSYLLPHIIQMTSQLFVKYEDVLLDEMETSILQMTISLISKTVNLADRIRQAKVSVGKTVVFLVGGLRALMKGLEKEFLERQRMVQLETFAKEYKRSHEILKLQEATKVEQENSRMEHEAAEMEHEAVSMEQDATREKRDATMMEEIYEPEEDAPQARRYSPEGQLPEQSHPSKAAHTGIEWSVSMDEELVQGLYRQGNVEEPEKYRRCLLCPSLQNLLPEHIRERALIFRPSLIGWYEERGESAPDWVTSIS